MSDNKKTIPTNRRGFAAMDPARVRELASMGGKKAHANGCAHEWTSDEARAAGHRGGLAAQESRRKSADY